MRAWAPELKSLLIVKTVPTELSGNGEGEMKSLSDGDKEVLENAAQTAIAYADRFVSFTSFK